MSKNNEHFLNRELAQLEFNRRVLAQAKDASIPLLERLRFLAIVSSNLDEFFEIRVAGLLEQIRLKLPRHSGDGLTAQQAYPAVAQLAHTLVTKQYEIFQQHLLPELANEKIRFLAYQDKNEDQQAWVHQYFAQEIRPLLTPIGLDPAHPFPQVVNKSLHFIVELSGKDAFGRHSHVAIVKAPRILPRAILLPRENGVEEYNFVWLYSIIQNHIHEVFGGMKVLGCYQFRLTRNSDLFVDEEEVKDLRQSLQGELSHRQFGNSVRLEITEDCPKHLTEFLLQQFNLQAADLYTASGPVSLIRLTEVISQIDRPDLKFPPFLPGLPKQLRGSVDLFAAIREEDILLHHPFQSFQPVLDFIESAATDPQVIAIKQTVYRTGYNSTLMEALIKAAKMGKEVTVIVELMARFDEEANINWAARLEEAGAQVVYGVVGLKIHAKMALVIRREEGALKLYAHLGTGNYHPNTTKLYTDFGMLTANPELCADVNEVFLNLTGLGKASTLNHLYQAPFTLHSMLISAIQHEAAQAQSGKPAHIIAKMNALLEEGLIEALYAASQAGVKIELIVRGVCALRPGIPGLSENIRVRSIVGRFLEHHRIFYFQNGQPHQVYLASADWMGRNLFRRVEVAWPILDPKLKKRVLEEGLTRYLNDTLEAWEMQPDGSYKQKRPTKKDQTEQAISAQKTLMGELAEKITLS